MTIEPSPPVAEPSIPLSVQEREIERSEDEKLHFGGVDMCIPQTAGMKIKQELAQIDQNQQLSLPNDRNEVNPDTKSLEKTERLPPIELTQSNQPHQLCQFNGQSSETNPEFVKPDVKSPQQPSPQLSSIYTQTQLEDPTELLFERPPSPPKSDIIARLICPRCTTVLNLHRLTPNVICGACRSLLHETEFSLESSSYNPSQELSMSDQCRQWSNVQVCVFINSLGLAHLLPLFQAHQVDGRHLLSLTEIDLSAELGIENAKDKASIMSAVATLKNQHSKSSPAVQPVEVQNLQQPQHLYTEQAQPQVAPQQIEPRQQHPITQQPVAHPPQMGYEVPFAPPYPADAVPSQIESSLFETQEYRDLHAQLMANARTQEEQFAITQDLMRKEAFHLQQQQFRNSNQNFIQQTHQLLQPQQQQQIIGYPYAQSSTPIPSSVDQTMLQQFGQPYQ